MTLSEMRVGRVVVPLGVAEDWVRRYFSGPTDGGAPYAFPAYDRFDGGTTDPCTLSDGDLLAPTLLNVPVKVRSFYDLQRVRPRLEGALADARLADPLQSLDEATVRDVVPPLYEVLDDLVEKPWNVLATTLSKVLHRKRPSSVVLHDRWVRRAYVGDDAPVPRARSRTWAGYMTEVTLAVRHDLVTQQHAMRRLEEAAGRPGELSQVRLLDVVAWSARGRGRT